MKKRELAGLIDEMNEDIRRVMQRVAVLERAKEESLLSPLALAEQRMAVGTITAALRCSCPAPGTIGASFCPLHSWRITYSAMTTTTG